MQHNLSHINEMVSSVVGKTFFEWTVKLVKAEIPKNDLTMMIRGKVNKVKGVYLGMKMVTPLP